MSCKAILIAIHDVETTKVRLEDWTDDAGMLIEEVQSGNRPVITTIDCKACKEALEEGGAAEVEIEET